MRPNGAEAEPAGCGCAGEASASLSQTEMMKMLKFNFLDGS